MRCAACAIHVADGSRFCPNCGFRLDPTSAPTETSLSEPGATPSDSTPDRGRFTPGTLLARRYRIVGLIGSGGMGVVYRADDLKLGQPVALKFLSSGVARDEARLNRFLNEVKTALRVTHPGVCRVYDIGEVDPSTGFRSTGSGQARHFISMEYVDGEDLASLLRRIGQIPRGKAIEIARQLCAGLAAAHEQGILHRDLKPANVMIDGRGRAKITDFGLASLSDRIDPDDVSAGTPGYMAPEQLAGKEVTVKSDLYSLGLVLYELFTGQRAFRASTLTEMARIQEECTPEKPSRFVEGLDPAVERVILRCLERDPDDRPESALSVAAAMPGGNLLAAALAAGETPAPELVAASREREGLSPPVAWACLAAFAAMMLAIFALASRSQLTRLVRLDLPPEVLENEARRILVTLGHDSEPQDTTHGFKADRDHLSYLAEQDRSPSRWNRLADLAPSPVRFWYRESPRPLIPYNSMRESPSPNDPPLMTPDMARVWLDSGGRLLRMEVVAPDSLGTRGGEPDWPALFAEAGLDPMSFTPVEPERSPRVNTDARAAWTGEYPGGNGLAVRVEAGAIRGRLVHFRIHWPWDRSDPEPALGSQPWEKLKLILLLGGLGAAMLGGLVVARRNQRLGRGDLRGATRVALLIFALQFFAWLLRGHHGLSDPTFTVLRANLAWALYSAALVWVLYVALEPYARRLWPQMLVGWVRVLDGRFRDPTVGRELLVGSVFGALWALVVFLYQGAPALLDLTPPLLHNVLAPELEVATMQGLGHVLAALFAQTKLALYLILSVLVFLVLLRLVLRKHRLAVAVTLAVVALIGNAGGSVVYVDLLVSLSLAALMLFIAFRHGLLAVTLAGFTFLLSIAYPLTLDFSKWYAAGALVFVVVMTGLAVYGFVIAIANRPVFKDVLPD